MRRTFTRAGSVIRVSPSEGEGGAWACLLSSAHAIATGPRSPRRAASATRTAVPDCAADAGRAAGASLALGARGPPMGAGQDRERPRARRVPLERREQAV